MLAQLAQPIPGINLGVVEVPPGSPSVPAPVFAKGIAGGVAALDADGDVVDASGTKVTGGDPAQIEQVVDAYLTANPPAPGADGAPGATTIAGISGLQTALDGKATTAQGAKAETAVQPADLTKAAVGLGDVDNTSDVNKPVSTAQASAINAKVGSGNSTITGIELYATVGALPSPGVVGVLYIVDA